MVSMLEFPEIAPNPTNSCGISRGDNSDQAYVIHHVRIGVRRGHQLRFLTPLESWKGTAAPKCYCVIAISTHELVIPYRTKVIEKYLGTLNSPVVLST
jgi:hypothetical protein